MLWRLGRHGREAIGQTCACRLGGEEALGIGPDKAGHAHGSNTKRHSIVGAEKATGQIGRLGAVKHGGRKFNGIERCAVARGGDFTACTAVEVFKNKMGDTLLSAFAKIFKAGVF